MPERTLTIREHLEAIRDQHFRAVYRLGLCRCGEDYPCSNREHAVAALDQMEAAKPVWLTPCMRAWHPLRHEQALRHCEEHGCGEPLLGRFIPDPERGAP